MRTASGPLPRMMAARRASRARCEACDMFALMPPAAAEAQLSAPCEAHRPLFTVSYETLTEKTCRDRRFCQPGVCECTFRQHRACLGVLPATDRLWHNAPGRRQHCMPKISGSGVSMLLFRVPGTGTRRRAGLNERCSGAGRLARPAAAR